MEQPMVAKQQTSAGSEISQRSGQTAGPRMAQFDRSMSWYQKSMERPKVSSNQLVWKAARTAGERSKLVDKLFCGYATTDIGTICVGTKRFNSAHADDETSKSGPLQVPGRLGSDKGC